MIDIEALRIEILETCVTVLAQRALVSRVTLIVTEAS